MSFVSPGVSNTQLGYRLRGDSDEGVELTVSCVSSLCPLVPPRISLALVPSGMAVLW